MATNKKSTANATLTTSSKTKSSRLLNTPTVQNFHLVWLDGSIDEDNNEDCRNSITKLRQVVNTVNTFTDVDECIDFITDMQRGTTFMMVSGSLCQTIVPVIQDISQVSSVYIYCENKELYKKWAQTWPKIKDAYTDITSICVALKQVAQDCDHNSISISFVKPSDGATNQNLNELDQSFMYTQILKEILLTINFEQKHTNEFLMYCREQFIGNSSELKNVDKIEKEYRNHEPIWWYTYGCFLYPMLNRALRLMEVDLIIKMGFFVRDLHNHINMLHVEKYGGQNHSNPFIVYRGQGLSQADFNQLKNTQGGLISFNNFLSTSLDREVSFAFAESNQDNLVMTGVLFEITINPSISSTPFANIRDISGYQTEEEILFSMHSVFRLGQVKKIDGNNRLWQVDLTLTSDNDPQLHALTASIREETRSFSGWHQLGQLMIKLGQFNKAEELYETLLKQPTNERENAYLFNQLGLIKSGQGNYAETVEFFEKALEIYQKTLPPNHPGFATSYNNIGAVYDYIGEYSKTLSYYEKALEIYQKTLPANHHLLAISYNNIGAVCTKMGEFSKALSYYEKALEIRQKTLPPNHPDLAISYNSIGSVYSDMGEYSKAFSYYEKAFKIRQKTLPANHPDLAISYNNIGGMYKDRNDYLKALSYYEKALEIFQKTLPTHHPSLATLYNNIGRVYDSTGEYSKALSYGEKALEVYQKTLSANHPDLAISYNNIGGVYDNMGEYSKALLFYKKALEIREITLPANHPDLATSYGNMGSVYDNMGEYSKALSYHEKGLEIRQKTLPANHPDLATSYNNAGVVYNNMGEFSKALSYYEKALEIRQETLPANHHDLAASYNNIGLVYNKMGEYSKALSYYEKALEIFQKTCRENHPNLATSYNNIGGVYDNVGEYSKSLLFYKKALEIREITLSANHPSFAVSYNNIAFVYESMKEYSKALLYFERAQNIWQSSLPPNHPYLTSVRKNIETVKKEIVN